MANGVIKIKSPYVTRKNGLCRMKCEIDENGAIHHVFAEVEEEYATFLTADRGDAFAYLCLPIAMREGYDIQCDVPITEQFLHNLAEILIPHLALGDPSLYASKIQAPTCSNPIGGTGVGTAISCGVDSLYTVMEYSNGRYPSLQLTHLFISSVSAELWNTKNKNLRIWVNEHKTQFNRYDTVSRELALPLVKVYTNFFHYVCHRDWAVYHHLFTHHYISMASVLALKKLWRTYFFASAIDFSGFNLADNAKKDTDAHELLSVHVLSTPDFSCFSGGAKSDRIQKTMALVDWELARRVLHPCHTRGEKNCSKPTCNKCLRALLTLDYYDKLDTMGEVFDIEQYREERSHYLVALRKLRNNVFLTQLYRMFWEKYPKDMAKARRDARPRGLKARLKRILRLFSRLTPVHRTPR